MAIAKSSLLIAIPLLLACPAYAQRDIQGSLSGNTVQNMLEIAGQVRLREGGALAVNISVRLEQLDGNFIDQVETDSTGRFRFQRLSPNQYMVISQPKGYLRAEQQVDMRIARRAYVAIELVPDKAEALRNATPAPGLLDARISAEAQKEYDKAREALSGQKYQRALLHLEKAVSLSPQYFQAQLLLGTTYTAAREYGKAENALRQALKLNPKSVVVYVSMGDLHRRQKKYPDAEKILLEALKLDKRCWQSHFTLGRVYWEMGDPIKAGPHVAWALETRPEFDLVHLLAGNIFMRVRMPENALVEYQEYLRLAPNGEFAEQARELVAKLEKVIAEAKSRK